MFAYQGKHIVDNIGPVFRVFVPMVLYFVIMWTGAFTFIWSLGRRERTSAKYGYEMAVVQSFTAGSNNFVSSDHVSIPSLLTVVYCRSLPLRSPLPCMGSAQTKRLRQRLAPS